VGCAAELRDVQLMPDGRSNIVVSGVMRYRLDEYTDTGEPYFTGRISFFADIQEKESEEKLAGLSKEVAGLFTRVANAAHKISGERNPLPDLPDIAPQELSFLISAAFNFENEVKLELMETRSTTERLKRLRVLLKRAVDTIEETAAIHQVSKTNGHSKKKINLD
jgi:Lon protease-like protein